MLPCDIVGNMRPRPLKYVHDRHFMNPFFKGYRMTTEPVPVQELSLPAGLECCILGKGQHSPMHKTIYGSHNHLFRDLWFPGFSYYVDVNLHIRAIRYDLSAGVLDDQFKTVLQLDSSDRKEGSFYVTLRFVSATEVIICDGTGNVLLAETGDRSERPEWTVLFRARATSNECLVQDARVELVDGELNNKKQFNCLLVSVRRERKRQVCFVDWMVIEANADGEYTMRKNKCIKGPKVPSCVALEPKCGAVILSSNRPFWTEGLQLEWYEEHPDRMTFGWNQTDKEIILKFIVRPDSKTGQYNVSTSCRVFRLCYRLEKMMQAKLYADVDELKTIYLVKGERLTITLVKSQKKRWPSLLEKHSLPETGYKDLTDPDDGYAMITVDMRKQPYDIPFRESEYEYYIDRIDATTDRASMRYAGQPRCRPCFSMPLRPGGSPALAYFEPPNIMLWAFEPPVGTAKWEPQHIGILNGTSSYLKQTPNAKFMLCAPSGRYTAMVESRKSIFFFLPYVKGPGYTEEYLGSRPGIGRMRSHKMPSDEAEGSEVRGMAVEEDVTLLITDKAIMAFKVHEETLDVCPSRSN